MHRYEQVIEAYQKSRRAIDVATGTVKISQQFIVNAALLANLLLACQQLARGDMNVGGNDSPYSIGWVNS